MSLDQKKEKEKNPLKNALSVKGELRPFSQNSIYSCTLIRPGNSFQFQIPLGLQLGNYFKGIYFGATRPKNKSQNIVFNKYTNKIPSTQLNGLSAF